MEVLSGHPEVAACVRTAIEGTVALMRFTPLCGRLPDDVLVMLSGHLDRLLGFERDVLLPRAADSNVFANEKPGAKRIYLAGPMTGLPEENKPAFIAEAARLRGLGYVVMNPAEVTLPVGEDTWSDFMRADLVLMMGCDAVYLLPGWEKSNGATIERNLAVALGFEVVML